MLLTWALILVALVRMVAGSKSYGEYNLSFKYGCECQVYVPLTIVYRLLLGACMALIDDNNVDVGVLLIVLVPLFFLVYNSVNLPFVDTCHNYRATFIHISELALIYITNFYGSIKKDTPMEEKARIYAPIYIELGLFVVCCVLSLGVLAYEYSQLIK